MKYIKDTEEKIAYGIEKLGQVCRVLKWEVTKKEQISPIQINILLYIRNNPDKFCNINNLSREFSLSQATVSEAVKNLVDKGYLIKERDMEDRRVFIIKTTARGERLCKRICGWSDALIEHIGNLEKEKKERILVCLMEVLKSLNNAGVIELIRMCLTCKHFIRDKEPESDKPHFCRHFKKQLSNGDLLVHCPHYVPESKRN